MAEPLEHLLDQLKHEGTFDSSGRFTLNMAQALEKMNRFRLAEPHLYVLNLVSAAVASGATFLRISVGPTDMLLEHDGRPYSHDELSQLFSSMADGASDEMRCAELAIGLHGARSTAPRSAAVASWQAGVGSALTLGDTFLEVTPLRQCPWGDKQGPPWRGAAGGVGAVTVRIQVRERVGMNALTRLLGKLTHALPPTSDAIMARCGLASIPILLNGEAVNRPLALGRCRRATLINPATESPGLPRLGRDSVHYTRNPSTWVEYDTDQPYSAIVAVGEGQEWGQCLTVVVHGVSFRVPGSRVGANELRGLVYAPFLRKDLSQDNLVEGPEFLSLMQQLQAHSEAPR